MIWKKSTQENLKIFIDRLFILKEVPARFLRQIYNLWTPTSFPVFRLLQAQEKYDNVPHAGLIAYIAGGMYVFVIVLGLIGMICAEDKSFQFFSVTNMVLLLSIGLFFLMCSRFRIPFMYLFIVYTSVVLSDPKAVLRRMTLKRALPLAILLILFIEVIVSKRSSFGEWG